MYVKFSAARSPHAVLSDADSDTLTYSCTAADVVPRPPPPATSSLSTAAGASFNKAANIRMAFDAAKEAAFCQIFP